MTIQEVLTEGKRQLSSPCPGALIDTPALDAVLLLAEVLHMNHEGLVIHGNDPVTEKNRKVFLSFLERRRNGECVAYILGRKEFRGLVFAVNHNVLVPRPDTETLVEAALGFIGEKENLSLLDLCTGSGVVAISLKNERPSLKVSASDISAGALDIARLNTIRLLDGRLLDRRPVNSSRNKIQFFQSDLFETIDERYDIIVSNPPYIPQDKLETLAPELRLEPQIALDGGEDGLILIKKIIARSPDHLLPGGVLLLEADPGQMTDIETLLKKYNFGEIALYKDLAGRDRVISGRKSTTPP